MREQVAALGPAELSRAADLVNAGLLEMRGATAPRLLLELVFARVLLPSADDSVQGVAARLDRLERGVAVSAFSDVSAPAVSSPARPTMAVAAVDMAAEQGVGEPPVVVARAQMPQQQQAPQQQAPQQQTHQQQGPAASEGAVTPPWRRQSGGGGAAPNGSGGATGSGGVSGSGGAGDDVSQSAAAPTSTAAASPSGGGGSANPAAMRQAWPQVLEAVARRSKVAWVILQSVHVVGVEGRLLQLGFSSSGLRDNFHGPTARRRCARHCVRSPGWTGSRRVSGSVCGDRGAGCGVGTAAGCEYGRSCCYGAGGAHGRRVCGEWWSDGAVGRSGDIVGCGGGCECRFGSGCGAYAVDADGVRCWAAASVRAAYDAAGGGRARS